MKAVMFCLIGFALCCCNRKETVRLKKDNDSLKHELENRKALLKLNEDLIQLMKVDDKNASSITTRLNKIKEKIRAQESQLTMLEQDLHHSKKQTLNYQLLAEHLKDTLNDAIVLVSRLEDSTNNFSFLNSSLTEKIFEKDLDLLTLREYVKSQQEQLQVIEQDIRLMEQTLQEQEAEYIFSQALKLDEEVDRIFFAPAKKRETINQSIRLYEESYNLGKKEAVQYISELKSEL